MKVIIPKEVMTCGISPVAMFNEKNDDTRNNLKMMLPVKTYQLSAIIVETLFEIWVRKALAKFSRTITRIKKEVNRQRANQKKRNKKSTVNIKNKNIKKLPSNPRIVAHGVSLLVIN